jgi:DinB superfamily
MRQLRFPSCCFASASATVVSPAAFNTLVFSRYPLLAENGKGGAIEVYLTKGSRGTEKTWSSVRAVLSVATSKRTSSSFQEEDMNKMLLAVLFFVVWISVSTPALAQNSDTAASVDHTAPSYDMKAQSLEDLGRVQKKFVDLANAVPADKMTWRPAPDARSFAEVFLHVAGERYGILSLMGATPPASYDRKTFEKSTTDRSQIIDDLNKSWEFSKNTINGVSNADFAKLLPKLGPQANEGDVVYILVADAHEHLGQLVAYARENGIVPPWTVEQKKAAEKKAEQK